MYSSFLCAVACAIGSAPAAADGQASAPGSLRMREPGGSAPHKRATRQLAQAAAQPGDPAAAAELDGAAQPASAEPAPAASAGPAPAATDRAEDLTAGISDEEFARLAEQDLPEEVIVVTGSAIGRKSLTTPAPVAVLDRELLLSSGRSNVGEILQALPQNGGGANPNVNNTGDGTSRLDLRGLGTARTLTLINGRRVVGGGLGANSAVDYNMIPLAVVERVEILKDGASAVYGADAVGGVINVITRDDFDGSELVAYTGSASRKDGFTYNASFFTGYSGDSNRGRVVFSAGLSSQGPVFAGDRATSAYDRTYDYTTRTASVTGSPASLVGRIDARAIDTTGDGRPDPVDLCGAGVQYCTSDGRGGYRPFTAADLYNYQPVNYLYTPSSLYSLFSAGTYQLRPWASTFFEASYVNRKSKQQIAEETFIGTIPVSRNSMYNSLGGTVWGYQRRFQEFGPKITEQDVDTFRIVAGFKGQIPEDVPVVGNFKWELSYNYGRSDAEQVNRGSLIKSRLTNAIGPSFMSAAGVPTCGTPAAPIADCVPIDILAPAGSISAAAVNYLTFTGVRTGFSDQQTVLAQAHGQLAKLPNHGDLSFAIGGDFRSESGGMTPDPLTVTGDTTGSVVAPTAGGYDVLEGFAELSLVPISGKRFAEWVELSLAGRAFRYNTFGSGMTWKAGGLFRTFNGVAIRGTYSTAFRAPAILELYRGRSDILAGGADPCDTRSGPLAPDVAAECAAQGVPANAVFGTVQQRVRLEGNPDLEPETAKVFTAGIVLEPPQIKGLSLTADYWRNLLDGAIQAPSQAMVFASCYNQHVRSACELIHRNPAAGHAIDVTDLRSANMGGASGSGLDVSIAYDRQFGALGRFREQLDAQYLMTAKLDTSVDVLYLVGNYDGGARPKWRGNLSSLWQHPSGIGAGASVRFIGTYKECQANNCSGGAPARDVDRWYKTDLFAGYELQTAAGKTSVTVGVNNLLDSDPPTIYGGVYGDSDAATYDYLGRFFYARMSQTF